VIAVQADAIDVDRLLRQVAGRGVGGMVSFTGTVRESNAGRAVTRLEYHAYPEMAEREMERLARQARERFDVLEVALVHRIGRLAVGETAVAVVVGAAHRAEAFSAARWLIDTLKKTVPIWKKEFFDGGEIWIEGPGEAPATEGQEPS
jgi:molybdopterin synthase catalytic subunit